MGVYSTLEVSRAAALALLRQELEKEEISDDHLGNLLSALIEPKLLNAMIVSSDDGPSDSTLSSLF